MRKSKFLERISTKLIIPTIVTIVILVPVSFYSILYFNLIELKFLSSFVDISFKAIALLVGAIWTLNRLYVTRSDISHIKVEADVSKVPPNLFETKSKNLSLLIYRADILNTGNTLVGAFKYFIEINSVIPVENSVEYSTIYRWPDEGFHFNGPIEPKSWSATNDAVSIQSNIQVIQLFIYIEFEDKNVWTWHKTFDLSK